MRSTLLLNKTSRFFRFLIVSFSLNSFTTRLTSRCSDVPDSDPCRINRNRHGNGVSTYVQNSIFYVHRCDFELSNVKILWNDFLSVEYQLFLSRKHYRFSIQCYWVASRWYLMLCFANWWFKRSFCKAILLQDWFFSHLVSFRPSAVYWHSYSRM